jgi:hypothetical protein
VCLHRAHSPLSFKPLSSCVYAELIQNPTARLLKSSNPTMVLKKQTAKKSTGATAPRIDLHRASSRIKASRKAAKITYGKRPPSNRKGHPITNSISLNIQPDVPTHVLSVEVRGPVNLKADMDKDHDEVHSPSFRILQRLTCDQWCTACRNGGDCICCDSCLRIVCHRCIEYPKSASVVVCPSCHLHLDWKAKKRPPYEVN